MVTNVIHKITAFEAEAAASLFLSDHLPDRLTAGEPQFDKETEVWRVPVLLAYPLIGPIGKAGEIFVSAHSVEIVSHTPLNEMMFRARTLYEQHRESIEAAFSQAKNS